MKLTAIPAPATGPSSKEFLDRFHQAYTILRGLEEFRFLEKLERDQMEDYKTHATGVNLSDPYYERRSTYMAGMAEGLRRWIHQKEKYLENYQQLKEGEIANERTSPNPTAPRRTFWSRL